MKLLTILYALLASLPALAEGTSIRGGGDETAMDFALSLRGALQEIRERFPSWENQLDLAGLETAPDRATVFITSSPLVVPAGGGEQESVAANDPAAKTIWVNRARWRAISSLRVRRAIALHEFLSLERIEGTGRYPYSSAFLAGGESTILTGQEEPSLANWHHFRFDCHTSSKFRLADGNVVDGIGGNISVQSSWNIAGRTYDLRYALFSFQATDENPIKSQIPQFEQSYRAPERISAEGVLYEYRRRTIVADPASGALLRFEQNLPGALIFEEKTSDGRIRAWSWEAGRKRNALWETYTRRRPDGSREIASNWLYFPSSGNFLSTAENRVCTEDFTEGEWLSKPARAQIGPWIDALTKLSSAANLAAKEYAACNPDNCAHLERAAEDALRAFESKWDELYRTMQVKLAARKD